MLNEKEILILCGTKDLTGDIIEFHRWDECHYSITFKNGKSYRYSTHKITVLYSKPFDTTGLIIQANGIRINEDAEVFKFENNSETYYKIFQSGKPRFLKSDQITITSGIDLTQKQIDILNHYSEIARLLDDESSKRKGNAETTTFSLEKILAGISNVHPESVLATYIQGEQIPRRHTNSSCNIFPFQYNLSQKCGLEKALSSQISILEGPPGTGKTQTILNLLANLITNNKTVAVVSFNNEAIKNVRDKLASRGYGFLVANLGNKDNCSTFFNNPPQPALENWDSTESIAELESQLHSLSSNLESLLHIQNDLAKLEQQLSSIELEKQHFELNNPNAQSVDLSRSFVAVASIAVADYLADISYISKMPLIRRLLFKLWITIKHRTLRAWSPAATTQAEIVALQHLYYALKTTELQSEISRLELLLKNKSLVKITLDHSEVSQKILRKKLFDRLSKKRVKHFTLNNYKFNFQEFLQTYPILTSTNHSLKNCIPTTHIFDYIIIDEASQVDLVTAIISLSCCRNIVLVGDRKQLQKISNDELKNKLHTACPSPEYDYFTHNILSSIGSVFKEDVPQTLLREHYRCHPKIIGFCNQKFYDGQLIPLTSHIESPNPLTLVHTAPGNHMGRIHATEDKTGGLYNQRELDEIAAIVHSQASNATSLGIITPFRLQADKATSTFNSRAECDTVHKFQGREKHTIIMSTTIDQTASQSRCLHFADDPYLVNVAVSRATHSFILVTDHKLFLAHGIHISDLIRYIRYQSPAESIITDRIVSVFDILYKHHSAKLEQFKSNLLLCSLFNSENIAYTLISKILSQDPYTNLCCTFQYYLHNIPHHRLNFTPEERAYIHNGASVDFIIHRKIDKSIVCAIEVDGFSTHANNPKQLRKDAIKNSIFDKLSIPLLRLCTKQSDIECKLRATIDHALDSPS